MANFPIVATGSSTGGLEALQALFRAIPPDTGGAFVVTAHLEPSQEGELSELLGQCTGMPVEQIDGDARLQPGRVYLIAPDQAVEMKDGAVRRSGPAAWPGQRHPVDMFFRSLAEDQGERAIGVVLTGSGSDGSSGLRCIKAQGGIVIAQDPEAARFPDMPRSAIGTGLVDLVLPPGEIGRTLGEVLAHWSVREPSEVAEERASEESFEDIVGLLRSTTGTDYSTNAINRRIRRRMRLHRIDSLAAYVVHLRDNPDELSTLVADMTISAKSFFRDPEAWEELHRNVISPLVRERPSNAVIRGWVSGCSTGEEAYSIAMLITEEAEAQGKNVEVRLFATDVAAGVLSLARAGKYTSSIEQDVSPERLERFFDLQGDDTYSVKKSIRDMVTFVRQNLLQDPRFSHLDLVACRNLLIDLEPAAQKRALALFHFALNEGGYLFLGTGEPIFVQGELFGAVSERWRIFRRLEPTRHGIVDLPSGGGSGDIRRDERRKGAPSDVQRAGASATLDRNTPASVTIDDRFRIQHLRGPTEDYLHEASGAPGNDVLTMAREGLPAPIRSVVRQALELGRESSVDARVQRDGRVDPVRIVAAPFGSERGNRGLLVTFFNDGARSTCLPEPAAANREGGDLQREPDTVRKQLSLTVEQMEEASEELKASNEEIRSVNEELQASNEELATAKEELQSLNDALGAVNTQLEVKVSELEERTADLNNFLKSTDLAALFLDRSLCIRWFTHGMKNLLDLGERDHGSLAGQFVGHFADDNLLDDAQEVLKTLRTAESEVLSDGGRWFMRRIQPYSTSHDSIDGLVITFVDITDRKWEAEARRRSEERLQRVLETDAVGVFFLEHEGHMVDANDVFLRMTGLSREEARSGRIHWRDATPPEYIEETQRQMDRLQETGRIGPYEKEYYLKDGSRRWMLFAGRDLGDGTMSKYAIDITDRKRAEEELELLTHELSHRVKNTLAVVQSLASQTDDEAGSVEEYKQKFLGRLRALGRAHGLLLEAQWRGTDLGKLVERELAPYHSQSSEAVQIEGAPAELSVRQALGLSLVLHELGTNALKYGALSVPDGNVRVNWAVEGPPEQRTVRLIWRESGGPTVISPRRKGFGTKLVDRALAHEIGAETKLDFSPDGLSCEIAFPLEN